MRCIKYIRTSRRAARFSIVLTFIMMLEAIAPTVAMALTGGPSQPEVQSFEPVGTSEMVDPFTGDFNYNIPLLDVGGYPVNIAYHSGITMDQEASWVGLGWNINAGVINRNMRNLADEFKGDTVRKEFNMKKNSTFGLKFGGGLQITGVPIIPSASFGGFYNNYKGVGVEWGLNISFSAGDKSKFGAGLGLNANSESGVGLAPSLSFSQQYSKGSAGVSIGLDINSRQGLKGLTMSVNHSSSGTYGKGTNVKEFSGGSSSVSGYMSFANPTYITNVTPSLNNYNLAGAFTIGGEVKPVHINGTISGYLSEQYLEEKEQRLPAFGYLHSDKGNNKDYALMDFNREKDNAATLSLPNLPVTSFTYDLYSVSGQGVSGMYRPFRSDVGVVFDSRATNRSSSMSASGEIGLGDVVHGGTDMSSTQVFTSLGKWNDADNYAKDSKKFTAPYQNGPLYENVYFKTVGELTPESDQSYLDYIGNKEAVRVPIKKSGWSFETDADKLTAKMNDGIASNNPGANKTRAAREKRNQTITFLTNNEKNVTGIPNQKENHTMNTFSIDATTGMYQSTTTGVIDWPAHHIGEVSTITPDGRRYIYGLPAYNYMQREVSFSVRNDGNANGRHYNTDKGLAIYNGDIDNTVNNELGMDNFFSATQLPPFAHSHMLTSILSADYCDVTQNGPSDDDYGTYFKFNYSKAPPGGNRKGIADDYRWRQPYGRNAATLSKGHETEAYDDKASYIYGNKELWYLHSIVSKNYVAEFHVSTRKDGWDVNSENGGIGNSPSYQLDSICLYTKPDKIKNGINAVPIKTVHFTYDYSLCQGVENTIGTGGDKGKLTLKSIYFTYGRSRKGRLSPYTFTYSAQNPGYHLKKYDRWGYFKTAQDNPNGVSNDDYPYAIQNPATADNYASAWTLSEIKMPSGGKIKMTYESDDYAYVQDRRAMYMATVKGFSKTANSSSLTDRLYDDYDSYNYVYFDLGTSISNTGDVNGKIRKMFFENSSDIHDPKNIKQMLFKMKIMLGRKNDNQQEFVTGYVEPAVLPNGKIDCGLNTANTTQGWVRVKEVSMGDKKSQGRSVHGIARATWNYTKLNFPRIAYQQSDPEAGAGEQFFKSFVSTFEQLGQFLGGAHTYMREKEMGCFVDLSSAWLRLNHPLKAKKGGGLRVKKIEVLDEWDTMTANAEGAFSYGQQYSYTMEENGDVISSGVSAYEPVTGGEENPFKLPIFFTEKHTMALDDNYSIDMPMGESFAPSPTVGYRKVTVTSLKYGNVTRHATGKTVHEFYTAYDFPTQFKETRIKTLRKKTPGILQLLKVNARDNAAMSQGYTIILNDMHGKPKAQSVYAEGATVPMTWTRYDYKTNSTGKLDNNVNTISGDGIITVKEIGVDYDPVLDMKKTDSRTIAGGAQINIEAFKIEPIPLPVPLPIIIPSISKEETVYKSVVFTKVINQFGILIKTTAFDLGSTVSTDNLLYDGETGDVLLTKVTNEFKDPIYNFNYPAHWAYKGMESAYKNIGAKVRLEYLGNGEFERVDLSQDLRNYFTEGDETVVRDERLWVLKVTTSKIYAVTISGKFPTVIANNVIKDYTVYRSGRRNMQSLSVGSIQTLFNPIALVSGQQQLRFYYSSGSLTQTPLQAQAKEFSDKWDIFCGDQGGGCVTYLSNTPTQFIRILNYMTAHNHLITNTPKAVPTQYNSFGETIFSSTVPGYSYSAALAGANKLYIKFNRGMIKSCLGDSSFLQMPPGYSFTDVEHFTATPADTGITIYAHLNNGADIVPVYWNYTQNSCFGDIAFTECDSSHWRCGIIPGDTINPYLHGMRGVWRPIKAYTYLADRKQAAYGGSDTVNTDIRRDGTFDHFDPFWDKPVSTGQKWANTGASDADWQWTAKITKYNPNGEETENVNPLNIYSGAKFGYNNTLPIAVASNAQYKEFSAEAFEDVEFTIDDCPTFTHTNLAAHTGLYSFKIDSALYLTFGDTMACSSSHTEESEDPFPFIVKPCYCNQKVAPLANKKYVFSFWIKESGQQTAPVFNYNNTYTTLLVNGTALSNYEITRTNIIDGWQQYNYTFTMPSQPGKLDIELSKQNSTTLTYIDDIRIFPFDGNMKSFVYHPVTLRLMAELDERNMATKYEYDEEGNLTRVKKETERGVYTIKETRSSMPK